MSGEWLFLVHQARSPLRHLASISEASLNVDPADGRIRTSSTTHLGGGRSFTWFHTVMAQELDPDRITIEGPDSSGIYRLRSLCRYFRPAVELHHQESVEAPVLATGGWAYLSVDLEGTPRVAQRRAIVESFRQFLLGHGAHPARVNAEACADLLAPMREAMLPAGQIEISHGEGKKYPTCQTLLLDGELKLVRQMERQRFTPDRWTFELLSLDERSAGCLPVEGDLGFWKVSLPAVMGLDTVQWQIRMGEPILMSSLSILMPDEATARALVRECTAVVPLLRQRLTELDATGA